MSQDACILSTYSTNWMFHLQSEQVLQLGLKSTDELFHVELYSWLIKYQLTEKLLEVRLRVYVWASDW